MTTNPSAQEPEIARLRALLSDMDPLDDDYATVLKHVKTLTELEPAPPKPAPPKPAEKKTVSPDVIVSSVVSLAGILSILYFEKLGVITSKALGFVHKIRI